jgi:hypothetical protein
MERTSGPTNVNLAQFWGFSDPLSHWCLFVTMLAVDVLYSLARSMCLMTVSSTLRQIPSVAFTFPCVALIRLGLDRLGYYKFP